MGVIREKFISLSINNKGLKSLISILKNEKRKFNSK